MGGVNVKITMTERVLQIVAPHPCSGCTKVGTVLCQDCKYDIIHEPFWGCILCGKPEMRGICANHGEPIVRAFTVSKRTGALEEAINRLKFHNTKAAARSLAELFDASLPLLPANIQIIPIPTVRSHIRQRGYDHVELIVRHFAGLRGLAVSKALVRQTNDTQHVVGRDERIVQSSRAFRLAKTEVEKLKGASVLLVDDIVTTGSTLVAAARLLSEAGAIVWVATLAYQPLD